VSHLQDSIADWYVCVSRHVFAQPLSGCILARMDTDMGRQAAIVLYVVAMIALIVGVDFAFFRNRFWERLLVNIGIVLVFGAFYSRFLRRP
jgi:hypothetical protein